MPMQGNERIAVLGMGNVLMRDDAWGPWVVEALLAEYVLPAQVSALDIGTPGLDLMPYVTDVDALILVDTVKSKGEPGDLRTYRRAQILAHPPQPRLSPHDPGLKEALLAAELMGNGPAEVLLVGAIPADTSMGTALSPALRGAIAPGVAAIVNELERLGCAPRRRAVRGALQVWWEAELHG
jgi:hydrogenase maturation protease